MPRFPPFISAGSPPMVMLVLGRDHKLYYEAYNDASDLDGDGQLDVGFNPAIEYYGYFDTNKCYTYDNRQPALQPGSDHGQRQVRFQRGVERQLPQLSDHEPHGRPAQGLVRRVPQHGQFDEPDHSGTGRMYLSDAHSWGKEYLRASPRTTVTTSRDYTPLFASGIRHPASFRLHHPFRSQRWHVQASAQDHAQ